MIKLVWPGLSMVAAIVSVGCSNGVAAPTPENTAAHQSAAVAKTPKTLSLSSCRELQLKGISKEVLIDEFLTSYPQEIFDPRKVERFVLTAAELDDVVANLGCAAGLSGYGPDVPEAALALFESKRYGKAAMLALRRNAVGNSVKAKAAREFADQMAAYLR